MSDKAEIVSRIIQIIQETEGDMDNDRLVNLAPLIFKSARGAFGTWEDALVAALVQACKGSRRHKVTVDAVVAEERHARERQEGWDAQIVVCDADGVIFTLSGAELKVAESGPISPAIFAPRGVASAVRCLLVNPEEDALAVLSDQGALYPVDSRVITPSTGPTRRPADVTAMASDERAAAILCQKALRRGSRFIHVTTQGRIKASAVKDLGRVLLREGVQALLLAEGDAVLTAFAHTEAQSAIFCANAAGNGIHFEGKEVRSMGLRAQGVKAMELGDFDAVVGAVPVCGHEQLLVLAASGAGKRVPLGQFRIQGRAGQGMILMRPEARGDEIAALVSLESLDDDVLIWTEGGRLARVATGAFPLLDRSARGQATLTLPDGDRISGACRMPGAGPASAP